MARSDYIYLVRSLQPYIKEELVSYSGEVVAAFTVKHEARSWASIRAHPKQVGEVYILTRMKDGISGDKTEQKINWGK